MMSPSSSSVRGSMATTSTEFFSAFHFCRLRLEPKSSSFFLGGEEDWANEEVSKLRATKVINTKRRINHRLRGLHRTIRKLGHDLPHGLACFFDFFRFERNSTDNRVTAAAITFTNLRDVVRARHGRPGIRTDRDLRALRPARQRYGVSRFRM